MRMNELQPGDLVKHFQVEPHLELVDYYLVLEIKKLPRCLYEIEWLSLLDDHDYASSYKCDEFSSLSTFMFKAQVYRKGKLFFQDLPERSSSATSTKKNRTLKGESEA